MRLILFWVITAIVFAWALKKPKVGLFYFLVILILRDGYLMENLPQIYQSWHIPMLAACLTLVSWFGHKLSGNQKMRISAELIGMIMLGAVIYVTRWHSAYPGNAAYMFEEYIRMAILAFMIINIITTKDDLRQTALILLSAVFFLVLYAYYRYKTEGFEYAIPSVYYVDRNFFAEMIVMILPLAFMFYEDSLSKIKKALFLTITIFMAAGVILTYSRGGLLALGIVLAALFLKSRKKVLMAITALIVLMLFLPHLGAKYTGRMSTVKTYEEDSSAMIRIATWQSGINMVKKNPVMGVGAGNFNDLFIDYVPPSMSAFADYTMSIHNVFLQIFSETGMLGGGLFIFILWASFYGVFYINNYNKKLPDGKKSNLAIPNALSVGLIGFCGAGFFLPGVYDGYHYIIIALLVASRMIYKEEMDKAEVILQ